MLVFLFSVCLFVLLVLLEQVFQRGELAYVVLVLAVLDLVLQHTDLGLCVIQVEGFTLFLDGHLFLQLALHRHLHCVRTVGLHYCFEINIPVFAFEFSFLVE